MEALKKRGIKHNDDYTVGLGDTLEEVLTAAGITQKRLKEWFRLNECYCTERKEWLNGVFHWHRKRRK